MVSSMHVLRRYVFQRALLMVLALACSISTVFAETDTQPESKIQAAFLVKFTSYVDWPASAFGQTDSPLVIGVLEDDEVADELSHLVGARTVNGHPLLIRRLAAGDAVTGSHVLFIGSKVGARLGKTLADIKTQPILTVTEVDGALLYGSVINFIVLDEQVRFDVSLAAAESGNLKISSRLLTVARQVIPVTP